MTQAEKIDAALEEMKRYALMGAKEMLTMDEAVSYTGLRRDTLYRMMSRRLIPYYKPNGRVAYFDRKELDGWLRRNKVVSREESEADALMNDYKRR